MFEAQWFFWGLALPALIAAAVVLGANCLSRFAWVVRIAPAFAVALGFEVGYFATYGWPNLPPVEAQEWVFLVLRPVALVVAVLVAARGGAATGVAWLLRLALAFGAGPLLLQPYLEHTWTAGQAWAWLAGIGVVAAIVWVLLLGLEKRAVTRDERKHTRGWLLMELAIAAGATGMAIMLSGSQTLGQLGLTLAAILAAIELAGQFTKYDQLDTSHVDVPLVILVGLWLSGCFYAELQTWQALLLMLAAQVGWLVEQPWLRRVQGWRVVVVRLAAATLIAGGVVIEAAVRFSREATDAYY